MPDIGYYSNIFPVELASASVEILIAERKNFPDLRLLRSEISRDGIEIFVYADEDKVYGYGKDLRWLSSKGFASTKINLSDTPRLTGRMILEGFVKKLSDNGFTPIMSKGRSQLFRWSDFKKTSDGMVKVHKGFDIRSLFLLDRRLEEIIFGLVIDVIYALRDKDNNRLNSHDIVSKFGGATFKEVRLIQGDLIPTGINTEVSRQRFIEEILPFVKHFSGFLLPCGIEAKLKEEPLRIILGGENESL